MSAEEALITWAISTARYKIPLTFSRIVSERASGDENQTSAQRCQRAETVEHTV